MALNPDARITVTVAVPAWVFPALLDGTTDIAMASAHQVQREMKVKSAGKEVEEVIVAYDASRRRGTPFQPRETTDTPTTGRYLRGKITN